jgi:hypothetical protein
MLHVIQMWRLTLVLNQRVRLLISLLLVVIGTVSNHDQFVKQSNCTFNLLLEKVGKSLLIIFAIGKFISCNRGYK